MPGGVRRRAARPTDPLIEVYLQAAGGGRATGSTGARAGNGGFVYAALRLPYGATLTLEIGQAGQQAVQTPGLAGGGSGGGRCAVYLGPAAALSALLAVAGAGAAGGVYVDKNYDISVEKKKDEKPDDT